MTQILDTTLRDGSYVVDFHFTTKDTALIATALEEAGIEWIEIGHGLGLGAYRQAKFRAASSDEDYMRAVAPLIRRARWGMFLIPGIAALEDLDIAKRNGMHFARVGTNVTEVEESEPFIRRSKQLGMFTSMNLMKTYAVTPEQAAAQAAKAAGFGADIVCVVDSAGCMLPDDVERYFDAMRVATDVPLGFHAHNNLGLANATTLRAIEMGAAIVDTSLRGMGRSSGNAVTEMMLLLMERRGAAHGCNVYRLLDVAERAIDPLLARYQSIESLAVIAGFASMHSSFLGSIVRIAGERRIDPRRLVVEVAKRDIVEPSRALIEEVARGIADAEAQGAAPRSAEATGPAAGPVAGEAGIPGLLRNLVAAGRKKHLSTVFNIVQRHGSGGQPYVSEAVHEEADLAMASAEVSTAEEAAALAALVSGEADFVLADFDLKRPESEAIRARLAADVPAEKLLPCSDLAIWARSLASLATELAEGGPIEVTGDGPLAAAVRAGLGSLAGAGRKGEAAVIVVCEASAGAPKPRPGATVVDGLAGGLRGADYAALHAAGASVVRPEMARFVCNEARSLIAVRRAVRERMGTGVIAGVEVASGGVVAPRGHVIVDSVASPSRVFGVADGTGRLEHSSRLSPEDLQRTARVERFCAIGES